MAPQGSNPSAPITEQVEKISCWICGRKFKKQKYLNSHLSYYHSTPCDSCGTAIFGNTCRIHQRSCENTEETEIEIVGTAERPDVNLAGTDTEGLQSEFEAISNKGSENELAGTGTEDPEIEFIGEESGKKAVEKYFPMGDEEHQENLDSIVALAHAAPTDDHAGLAHSTHVGMAHLNGHHNNHLGLTHAAHANNHIKHAPTNNHVGLAHATHANSGPRGGQSIPNGVHQMHHGGYPIHNGATPIHNGVHHRLHEGFPIHNGGQPIHGGQPMYFDGQSMQFNRGQFPMVNRHLYNHHLQQQLPRDQNQMQNQHGPTNYLGQNRTVVPMKNHQQMAAPTQNNCIKRTRGSFKGNLKEWLEETFRFSEGNLSIFNQTLQADMARQMGITLPQLKTWFKNRNVKKRKTGI